MKLLAFLLTIAFLMLHCSLSSCNNSTNNSNILSNETEKNLITTLFFDWRKQQIKAGMFWAKDSCNMAWVLNHDEIIDEPWGFPESSECYFSFADLNNDIKLDGLITFIPSQCDGCNAGMWTQLQVVILSSKENYSIIDTLDVSNYASTEFDSSGFYWLDSIATNRIFGTYFEFKDGDGHCCPSIEKHVVFNYKLRKLINIGNNAKQY